MLPQILSHLLSEDEFLSSFGIRSVSRIHAEHRDLGVLPGIGQAMIEYVPGELNSPLFGGNSNWRGPIWMPVNFTLIQAIEKFHRFLGDNFRVAVPCLGGRELNLKEIATLIAERIVDIYLATGRGGRPRCRRSRISPPMSTGRISCCSTNIFMPIPAKAWGRRTRPDGPD